jgi:hypothetical protein
VNEEKRKGGAVSLKDAVQKFLHTSGLAAREKAGGVFAAWNDAATATLGVGAPAVRFQAGELVVEACSSAHLQELKGFLGEELRQEANRRLGSEKIQRVTFRIGTQS